MRRTIRTAVTRARNRMAARRELRKDAIVEAEATEQQIETEQALVTALRGYIEARHTGGPVDDMVDDAIGAINETLRENWSANF